MPKRSPVAFAKIAYTAYGDHTNWMNYQGMPMPRWEDVGERIQSAWAAACSAVVDDLMTPPGHETRTGLASSFGRHAIAPGGTGGPGDGDDDDVVV